MADLHPDDCFCLGTGFLAVDDPHDGDFYVEAPCPGVMLRKRRKPGEPRKPLGRVLGKHEFVLSQRGGCGKSAGIEKLTDGSPAATIRLWSWDLDAKDWIPLHGNTCVLSAEETAKLGEILLRYANKV
jgi:hypothetical protein